MGIAFNMMKAIGQGHVAEFMVMAVGFPVGRDIDKLGIVVPGIKITHQPPGKLLTIIKKAFKSNSQGDRPIIKEDTDLPARWQITAVRYTRIDLVQRQVMPQHFLAILLDTFGLMRCQDRELDTLLGHQVQ